jgi:hypothetical protein
LPDSRWHLIDQWPGAAGYGRQILCQIIGHRRIYAETRGYPWTLDALLFDLFSHAVWDYPSRLLLASRLAVDVMMLTVL